MNHKGFHNCFYMHYEKNYYINGIFSVSDIWTDQFLLRHEGEVLTYRVTATPNLNMEDFRTIYGLKRKDAMKLMNQHITK